MVSFGGSCRWLPGVGQRTRLAAQLTNQRACMLLGASMRCALLNLKVRAAMCLYSLPAVLTARRAERRPPARRRRLPVGAACNRVLQRALIV